MDAVVACSATIDNGVSWPEPAAGRCSRDDESTSPALLGEEVGRRLPPEPTPEQAWAYVNELWAGDPGGRGWQVRVPAGATRLALKDDEDDPAPDGPEPA